MKINPDITIACGENILLKNLRPENGTALFQLVDQNRAHLRKFLGWLDHNKSEKDTMNFIATQVDLLHQGKGLTLGIWHKGNLIGLVDFHDIDGANRSAFIGYWLDQAHEGMGIMRQSVKALVDFGKASLKLHRLQIICATENTRSKTIAEFLNFKKEGVLKDAIWHYDRYFDAYLFALIA